MRITMDDVAAAAGVAKGTLYNHFPDKDELFFQTCIAGFDDLCELLEAAASDACPEGSRGAVPFERQLLDACRQISRFFDRRHQLLRMTQAEEARMPYCHGPQRSRWMAKRQRLVAAIARILAQGAAAGQVRRDLRPEVLANVLMGLLRTRSHGLADAPDHVRSPEVIADLFCHGAGYGPRLNGTPSAGSGHRAMSRCPPRPRRRPTCLPSGRLRAPSEALRQAQGPERSRGVEGKPQGVSL